MSNETTETETVNPKVRQQFHIANVVETFDTKREIEMHLTETTLPADQVIIKGKMVDTRPSVAIV